MWSAHPVDNKWADSPFSFGFTTTLTKSVVVPETQIADDDLEYQALATLRELSIPLESASVQQTNKKQSPISKRLTIEQRSSSSQRANSSPEGSLSPSSSSSSSSLSFKSNSSSTSGGDCASASNTAAAAGYLSVFIGRLPFDLTEEEFQSKLDPFTPQDCCICMNKRKKSKGFGFATFATEQQASKFVEYANDAYLFKHQKLPLRVEICTREN
jgi:RNA recognition motif-containing protein